MHQEIKPLIEFLLSDNAQAHSLRQAFNFHIYPAVNPEGVKYGHYRRSTESTLDPNRAWNASAVYEVEIVRSHILSQTDEVADYFFDLHGSGRSEHFIIHTAAEPRAREFVETVAARHPHLDTDNGQTTSAPGTSAMRWALYNLHAHHSPAAPPPLFYSGRILRAGVVGGCARSNGRLESLGRCIGRSHL